MNTEGKQIKIGAVLAYASVLLGIISGLIYNPWMIHTIGDADYGLYSLAMSLINIFLVDFGLSTASQRFVSKYRAEQDQQAVNVLVGQIFKLYLVITAVLAAIFGTLFFFLENIYVKLTVAELEKFKALYVIVAFYSVTAFPFIPLAGLLSAYEKFIPLKVCDMIHKVLTVVLTAGALFAGVGVYALVLVNLIASFVLISIRLMFVRKHTPIRPRFTGWDGTKVRELLGFSVWTFVSTIVMRLLLALGPSVLGAVSGSFEIAVFGYAVSIEAYVYAIVNAINGFFMPRLSRIHASAQQKEADQQVLTLMVTVGRFILALYGLIFVGFAAMGREFVCLLVGQDYANAHICVLLICGYGLVAYPQQIANTYAIVQNKVKNQAVISLIALAVYLLSVFTLGRLWGAIGISFAVLLALAIQTVLLNLLYQKILHIRIGEFFKQCHLKFLPGFAVFALLSAAITYIPLNGWIGFGVKVLLIVAVYAAVIWLLYLNKGEKKTLVQMLNRRRGGK